MPQNIVCYSYLVANVSACKTNICQGRQNNALIEKQYCGTGSTFVEFCLFTLLKFACEFSVSLTLTK